MSEAVRPMSRKHVIANERDAHGIERHPRGTDPVAQFSEQLGVLNGIADELLTFMHRKGAGHVGPIRVVPGTQGWQLYRAVRNSARESLYSTTRPPFVGTSVAMQTAEVIHMLKAVTDCRAIYDNKVVALDGMLNHIQEAAAAGEEARTLSRVPFKMLIADHRQALLTVLAGPDEPAGNDSHCYLLIGKCGFLNDLVDLFDSLWSSATPVRSLQMVDSGNDRLSTADRQLLRMLAAGATDEVAARQLGVSLRTVQRRVSRIEHVLGVRSRFQAGIQATRRQLI